MSWLTSAVAFLENVDQKASDTLNTDKTKIVSPIEKDLVDESSKKDKYISRKEKRPVSPVMPTESLHPIIPTSSSPAKNVLIEPQIDSTLESKPSSIITNISSPSSETPITSSPAKSQVIHTHKNNNTNQQLINSLQTENITLTKEIKKLNFELDQLDGRLIKMQKDLELSEQKASRYETSTKNMTCALDLVNKEKEQLQKDAAAQFALEFTSKDEKISLLEKQVFTLKNENEVSQYVEKENKLTLEISTLSHENNILKITVENEKSENNRLRNNEQTAENLRLETLQASQRREASLEANILELTQALVECQRKLEDKKDEIDRQGFSRNSVHEEVLLLREENKNYQKKLQSESSMIENLKKDKLHFEEENASQRHLISELENKIVSITNIKSSEIEDLKNKLNAAHAKSIERENINPSTVVQERIKELSNKLLEKQNVIDRLSSEKSMLEQKMKKLQSEANVHENNDLFQDEMESGNISSYSRKSNNYQLKQRGAKYNQISSQITPLFNSVNSERVKKVVVAVDAVDDLTMSAGNALRRYPLARLAFLLYIVILHVWVIFITNYILHDYHDVPKKGNGLMVPPLVNKK